MMIGKDADPLIGVLQRSQLIAKSLIVDIG